MAGQSLTISRRVAREKGATIVSIFGRVEAAVAVSMVTEGKLVLIAQEHIPSEVRFNDANIQAMFAVVIPERHRKQFEIRCPRPRT